MDAGGAGRRRWATALVLTLALVTGSLAVGEDAAAVPVSSGVYTDEQADLGRQAYALRCASCHGADLEGGFGPRLAPLDPFQFALSPLARPFAFMRSQMPFGAPGTLDDEVYPWILAHILRQNGYPSGPEPLPLDVDALAAFVLDVARTN